MNPQGRQDHMEHARRLADAEDGEPIPMGEREAELERAAALVQPPGVTYSSMETASDEGASPSAVIHQSRTASAIGVLIRVMAGVAGDVKGLTAEMQSLRTGMAACLVLTSATAAALFLLFVAVTLLAFALVRFALVSS